MAAVTPDDLIEWAARGRPIMGEMDSGDQHVAASYPGGVLLGVIDGLGHGPEAARAARAAVAMLEAHPGRSLPELFAECHEALRPTRGVVMSLASINAASGTMQWTGVGNVEAMLSRVDGSRERIVPRSGVVGYQLPQLRVTSLTLAPGDMLIFASDGLEHEFAAEPVHGAPEELADRLLRTYAREADDALVLVARYLGATA